MVSFVQTLLLALPLTALAVPVDVPAEAEITKRGSSGDVTYYTPGLGACGHNNNENDLIVAVSHILFDAEKPCGRRMRVTSDKSSVDVTVVDRCAGCAYGDVDLSPAAFGIAVGDFGLGRRPGSWEWI